MSQRCIFCGRTERDFDGKNSWSNEHIIPESLGNSTLVIKMYVSNATAVLAHMSTTIWLTILLQSYIVSF